PRGARRRRQRRNPRGQRRQRRARAQSGAAEQRAAAAARAQRGERETTGADRISRHDSLTEEKGGVMEPEQFREVFQRLEQEVQKVIVGHDDLIRKVLIAFFAGGHVLLEGVPGLGKTLLVKSLSRALGMSFKRIQFTPDLMPSDI